MAASKKRATPQPKRTTFVITTPRKVAQRTSRPPFTNHDALQWQAADNLFARLLDLRRRQRTGPIADRELVGVLEYWSTKVTLPQRQKTLAMDLAMTAWAFVSGKNDAEQTVERAMLHRNDGVELNVLQLKAIVNRLKLEPSVRAQLAYNVIAEGSAAAINPDTNLNRKGSLYRLICELNPYIDDE